MSEIIDSSPYSYNSNGLNKCVFINTNNPKVKSQAQKKNVPYPSVKLLFPPLIDPKDLLIIGKDNKPTRSPNAFIIYRKVFFKTVRDEGHILPMTAISSMASQSWEQEPDEIKKYYKTLAKEAYNYRNERFPKKINKRKKREKWNIISFKSSASSSNTSYFSSINDYNVSERVNDNLLNMQLPTPTEDIIKNPLIDAFTQFNSSSLQELIMSNEFSLNIFNNNSVQGVNNSINHLFEEDIAESLDLQQIYPSPNLSLSGESNFASPDLNEIMNSFPNENLQQMGNNNEQIEREEIQQFTIDDLQQQLFSLSKELTVDNNNDLTDLNSFDDLNAFLPNFSDFLDNVNNDVITAENFDLLKDDRITFTDEEFEKKFSL